MLCGPRQMETGHAYQAEISGLTWSLVAAATDGTLIGELSLVQWPSESLPLVTLKRGSTFLTLSYDQGLHLIPSRPSVLPSLLSLSGCCGADVEGTCFQFDSSTVNLPGY